MWNSAFPNTISLTANICMLNAAKCDFPVSRFNFIQSHAQSASVTEQTHTEVRQLKTVKLVPASKQ